MSNIKAALVKEILVDSKKKSRYKGLVVEDLVPDLILKGRLADTVQQEVK